MAATFHTPQDYIDSLQDDRKEIIQKIRNTIQSHLPKGFQECISYNMIGYVVPHEIYPNGYHCKPSLPLPFISLASQKNGIALHHLGIYANKNLLDWFVAEYPKHSKLKLDMGKGCIRFKKMDDIPYQLIAELVAKISVSEWIACYESNFKKS